MKNLHNIYINFCTVNFLIHKIKIISKINNVNIVFFNIF